MKQKIKCPQCGCVMKAQVVPGMETKNITCPICGHKDKYTVFYEHMSRVKPPKPSGEDTVYGNEKAQYDGETEVGEQTQIDYGVGTLMVVRNNKAVPPPFKLKYGMNVIGRNAHNSTATIKIDCPKDSLRMSRAHLDICVERKGGGTLHRAKLHKESVNATYLNSTKMEYGDEFVLKNGDRFRLPDVELRFSLTMADSDETVTDYDNKL